MRKLTLTLTAAALVLGTMAVTVVATGKRLIGPPRARAASPPRFYVNVNMLDRPMARLEAQQRRS